MNEFKIDDIFFKDEIDYKDLGESIYIQYAKTMAKNVDIDLAKTPLVDILTGYTKYRISQSKIDKAIDKLESLLPMCIMPNNMLIHGTEKAKTIEETLDILKEDK